MAEIRLKAKAGIMNPKCPLRTGKDNCPGYGTVSITLDELAYLKVSEQLIVYTQTFTCNHVHKVVVEK